MAARTLERSKHRACAMTPPNTAMDLTPRGPLARPTRRRSSPTLGRRDHTEVVLIVLREVEIDGVHGHRALPTRPGA